MGSIQRMAALHCLFQLPSFCRGLNLYASFFTVLRGMIPIHEICEGLNTITQPLT